jgi:hypothetical protein
VGFAQTTLTGDSVTPPMEHIEAGIRVKRLGSSQPAREIAITQSSGESGSVASFDPAWRPLPR